jgi:hypothetical protein
MDIFADALASKVVTAGATFRQRDTAIKHFANRFRLEQLYPTTLTKHMNARSYPVVLHDAEVMVQLLLKSSLMVEENMLFPDMVDNPLAPVGRNPDIWYAWESERSMTKRTLKEDR